MEGTIGSKETQMRNHGQSDLNYTNKAGTRGSDFSQKNFSTENIRDTAKSFEVKRAAIIKRRYVGT